MKRESQLKRIKTLETSFFHEKEQPLQGLSGLMEKIFVRQNKEDDSADESEAHHNDIQIKDDEIESYGDLDDSDFTF